MIKKYIYGQPIETNAVVMDIEAEKDSIQALNEIQTDDGKLFFTYFMENDDIVYGLGEANRGINKRGYIYESFCSDDPLHTEEKRSLYGAHNFIVISGIVNIGIFVDTPSQVQFDIGYTSKNVLKITPSDDNLKIYVIDGTSAYDIVKQFRKMIGSGYLNTGYHIAK